MAITSLLRRSGNPDWLLAVAGLVAVFTVALVFQNTFTYLYANWQREEYSHGFLIPLISVFMLWQRRHRFLDVGLRGSWVGVGVVALGVALYFVGSLSSINGIDAYALVVVIAGALLAVMGWEAFRLALVPVALLLLMNPLPTFLYNNFSAQLQLISSNLGVAVIRLLGVSVFLEGNVIDLGTYKLQVAEACSGLRYLFPLMTMGVIIAYLFQGKNWMRWCIFLSTVPITILMNSFRIGVIGVLVDRYGIAQAEGFLHDFEGWVIFMTCFALLFVECWLLLRLTGDRRSLRDVVALDFGAPSKPTTDGAASRRPGAQLLTVPALAVLVVLLAVVYPARTLAQRAETIPARTDFSQFPLQIGSWHGQRDRIESVYLDELKLDDYLLANYAEAGAATSVNFYAAYYASQRSGAAVHSPRSCLPGGGWVMSDFDQRAVAGVNLGGLPLRVNRAVIRKGDQRQLVYYWFQQRGRNMTNEYLVKWYLFADSMLRNRSDGALVRLVTPIGKGEELRAGDRRLEAFTARVLPMLDSYLPN